MRRGHGSAFEPRRILSVLLQHDVDFVVIGGLAAMARGSIYPSFDVDVAYARDPENLERLAAALRELRVTLRGAPPDLSFQVDEKTIAAGAMFTFETPFGSLDILSDPVGAPAYESLRAQADTAEIDRIPVRVASIDHLIAMKEATGRDQDKTVARELRVISDELRAPQPDKES